MKAEGMKQREMATKANITPRHMNDIIRGRTMPSPSLAKKLEEITGVNRLAWLYPTEFHNPMLRIAGNDTAAA